MAAIVGLLLLPMAALSVVTALVLNQQEQQFRESVEESIHELLPLTTLEHYLGWALVDEEEAETRQSVPDFASLTRSIDHSFSVIESEDEGPDLPPQVVASAQQAWSKARPSVEQLIEQVHSMHAAGDPASEARARSELRLALSDISEARRHLARAVQARYERAASRRHVQMRWLLGGWIVTLAVAAVLIVVFLRSLVRPIRALGQAAQQMGSGTAVRLPVEGSDELTAVAERFNEMAAYWESTHQSLLTEAAVDPLTGLLNRRGVLEVLETELAAHARHQQPLALLVMDLDRFKAINDRLGHAAGDRALIWVAGCMREALREGDHLGRHGGDEFMAVLPHTDRDRARQVADRIRSAINGASSGAPHYPGVSVGVAAAPGDGWDAAGLIDAADRMLYQAKGRGARLRGVPGK